jgi:hypothetical protein
MPNGDSALQRIIKKISDAIEELVTLRITTAVGAVDWTKDQGAQPANCKAMESTINLLDGDIKTLIDQAFVTGDFKDLRSFHQDREKQGHEIVQGNIAALKALLDLARSLITK